MSAPTAFVRDIYDGHQAPHYPAFDTPSHYCVREIRIVGKDRRRVPRYSLMLRERSELVVQP